MIPDDRIKKFQEIWKKNFGKEISVQDAHEKATKLLRIVELVYTPISENEFEKLQKRLKELNNERPNDKI